MDCDHKGWRDIYRCSRWSISFVFVLFVFLIFFGSTWKTRKLEKIKREKHVKEKWVWWKPIKEKQWTKWRWCIIKIQKRIAVDKFVMMSAGCASIIFKSIKRVTWGDVGNEKYQTTTQTLGFRKRKNKQKRTSKRSAEGGWMRGHKKAERSSGINVGRIRSRVANEQLPICLTCSHHRRLFCFFFCVERGNYK